MSLSYQIKTGVRWTHVDRDDWSLYELGVKIKPTMRRTAIGWECSGPCGLGGVIASAVGKDEAQAYDRWVARAFGHEPSRKRDAIDLANFNAGRVIFDREQKNAVARYRRLERKSPEWADYEVSG